MSKTQKIELLVDEFIRISTAKNAEGGNKKYNGALHGLYTAAQNILNVDVLGSRKNPGIFGGKTTLSEPENVSWNTANSYEAWMLAELNAYATNTPPNVTAPLQGNHSDFVGSLQDAKVIVMNRLIYDRILAIRPSTPGDTVATEIAELVNVINVLPDNAEKTQLARTLAEKYIARVDPTSTAEVFLKSYGFKRGGTRRKRNAKRLQSRRKYTSKVRYGRVGKTDYGQGRY